MSWPNALGNTNSRTTASSLSVRLIGAPRLVRRPSFIDTASALLVAIGHPALGANPKDRRLVRGVDSAAGSSGLGRALRTDRSTAFAKNTIRGWREMFPLR